MQDIYETVRDGLALFGALVVIAGTLGVFWVLTRGPDDFGV